MAAGNATLGEKVSVQDDWLEAPTDSGWFIIPLDRLAKPAGGGSISLSKLMPKKAWIWLNSAETPIALVAWLFVMQLFSVFLGMMAGMAWGGEVAYDPQFHAFLVDWWFRPQPGEFFSLQASLMIVQVLFLVWLWTKFRQARTTAKRISWQQYLFYSGLALLLLGQQQIFYKMTSSATWPRYIPLTTYEGRAIPDPTPDGPEPIYRPAPDSVLP